MVFVLNCCLLSLFLYRKRIFYEVIFLEYISHYVRSAIMGRGSPTFDILCRSNRKQELTMAISCELLACAMPRMLDVCITSTEKLGSQLAMRDPAREHRGVLANSPTHV